MGIITWELYGKEKMSVDKTEELLQVDIPNDDEEYLADNFHSFVDTFCHLDTRCEPNTAVRITVERVTLDE